MPRTNYQQEINEKLDANLLEHREIRDSITKVEENLSNRIDKRPTFSILLTIAGIGISILLALFTFITNHLLNNQTRFLKSETQLIVNEAIAAQKSKDERTWLARKNEIINELIAKYIKKR